MEDEVPCIGAISSITHIANIKFLVCILNPKMFLTTLTTLNSKQAEYAATVMHILGHLGGIDMVNELNGDKVHRLENIMTITLGAHNLITRCSCGLNQQYACGSFNWPKLFTLPIISGPSEHIQHMCD